MNTINHSNPVPLKPEDDCLRKEILNLQQLEKGRIDRLKNIKSFFALYDWNPLKNWVDYQQLRNGYEKLKSIRTFKKVEDWKGFDQRAADLEKSVREFKEVGGSVTFLCPFSVGLLLIDPKHFIALSPLREVLPPWALNLQWLIPIGISVYTLYKSIPRPILPDGLTSCMKHIAGRKKPNDIKQNIHQNSLQQTSQQSRVFNRVNFERIGTVIKIAVIAFCAYQAVQVVSEELPNLVYFGIENQYPDINRCNGQSRIAAVFSSVNDHNGAFWRHWEVKELFKTLSKGGYCPVHIHTRGLEDMCNGISSLASQVKNVSDVDFLGIIRAHGRPHRFKLGRDFIATGQQLPSQCFRQFTKSPHWILDSCSTGAKWDSSYMGFSNIADYLANFIPNSHVWAPPGEIHTGSLQIYGLSSNMTVGFALNRVRLVAPGLLSPAMPAEHYHYPV